MSDELVAAPAEAPGEQSPMPASDEVTIDRSAEPTPSNAIDRAFAAVDKMDQEQEQEPAPQSPDERLRTPDGKFAAKEQEAAPGDGQEQKAPEDKLKLDAEENAGEKPKELESFKDAPDRFSPDAKAVWKDAPEPVRAEISRAVSEMEAGLEQHREAFEPYKDFAAELAKNGQDFQTVLGHYTGIESMLAQDPIKGLETICTNLGMSLRQVSEHVLQQQPNEAAAQQENTMREMRQEVASLKQELGGVSTTLQSQSEQVAMEQLQTFAADKPRFDELSPTMAQLINSGMAKDIGEAYQKAEMLNPSQQTAPVIEPAPADPKPAPAQSRKGSLSLGSKSSGSNPVTRQKPSSIGDTLEKNFASVGL